MADSGKQPKGVRGPGGPPPAPTPGSRAKATGKATGKASAKASGAPRSGDGSARASGGRASLERASYPLLLQLRRVPRWLMVVLPGVLLFAGLVMPASLAWLGGVLLALVGVFLGWLLLLSWPVLGPSSRLLRLIVIVAVLGIAWFKALGRL